MKVIIKIGHMEVLLPNMTGVDAVIRTLSKGIECRPRLYDKEVWLKDPVSIEMKTIPDTGIAFKDYETEVRRPDPYKAAAKKPRAKALPPARNILRLTN